MREVNNAVCNLCRSMGDNKTMDANGKWITLCDECILQDGNTTEDFGENPYDER